MKPSTTNVLQSLGVFYAIMAIVITLINLTLPDSDPKNNLTPIEEFLVHNRPIVIILACSIFLSFVIAPYAVEYFDFLKLKRRKLSNIIVEKKVITLDLTKKGARGYYQEKTDFCKIGYGDKYNQGAYMEIMTSGIIEPVSALHCAYRLNAARTVAELEFVDHPTSNSRPLFVKKHNKFLMFSAIIHDAFTGKKHSWDLIPRHYYKEYCLQILLDFGQKLKSTSIVLVEKDSNGKEIEKHLPHILPVISKQNERTMITMQLIDYDEAVRYRLKWKIA